MAGGDLVRTQRQCVVEKGAELDLGIAQHVGIRRPARLIFTEKFAEHALLVFGGEIHHFQTDANDIGSSDGIDKMRGLLGRSEWTFFASSNPLVQR